MPRGRKRKAAAFLPPPWIHNSSSEDEYQPDNQPPLPVPAPAPAQPLNGKKFIYN